MLWICGANIIELRELFNTKLSATRQQKQINIIKEYMKDNAVYPDGYCFDNAANLKNDIIYNFLLNNGCKPPSGTLSTIINEKARRRGGKMPKYIANIFNIINLVQEINDTNDNYLDLLISYTHLYLDNL